MALETFGIFGLEVCYLGILSVDLAQRVTKSHLYNEWCKIDFIAEKAFSGKLITMFSQKF